MSILPNEDIQIQMYDKLLDDLSQLVHKDTGATVDNVSFAIAYDRVTMYPKVITAVLGFNSRAVDPITIPLLDTAVNYRVTNKSLRTKVLKLRSEQ